MPEHIKGKACKAAVWSGMKLNDKHLKKQKIDKLHPAEIEDVQM